MKLGPAVIGIIIAGALGYFLEPSISPALMSAREKEDATTNETLAEPGTSVPKPPAATPPVAPAETAPKQSVPAWVLELTPEQLPEKVTLKQRAALPVSGSDEPMVLPAGVSVTTVRVEQSYLVVSPFGGPMEGKVPIISTDLVDLLGDEPPTGASNDPTIPAVEAPPTNAETQAPMPEEPEPAESAAPSRLTDEEIVAVMQESVKSGSIKEFTFDLVLGWKAAEDKESGGQTYQSGLVSYKAETIFGVKNIQAQALIKDGKVVKWIWPKSGMEIN